MKQKSLENYLKQLSYHYYLKKDTEEKVKIEKSIHHLFKRLDKDLGDKIKRRFIFGSYERNTILPRQIDRKSDVDIMVVFNHSKFERTPTTYRKWLRRFANENYKNRYGSVVVRSTPTIQIRLQNIHYDLVPAKEEKNWRNTQLYIPCETYTWQSTDPKDVKDQLIAKNKRHRNNIKPVVRLLKAWNCTKGYPYDSYELELMITRMYFFSDNIQDCFIAAAQQLHLQWNDSKTKRKKVERLRKYVSEMEQWIKSGDFKRAKQQLHKVLPLPQ